MKLAVAVAVVGALGCGSKGPAATDEPDLTSPDAPPADATEEPTAFTDGLCTPSPIPTGVFDADCIYLLGTTLPGSSGFDVVANLLTPDEFMYGFGRFPNDLTIRHTDGRLLFIDQDRAGNDHVFGFTPDSSPPPFEPLENDLVLATPGCANGVSNVSVFPDDGIAAYQCFRTADDPVAYRLFLEGESTPLEFLAAPVALGAGRRVLLEQDGALSLFAGGVVTEIQTPAFQRVVAARFLDGGFVVALGTFEPTESKIEVVQIDRAGKATRMGELDLGDLLSFFIDCKFAPDRSLICMTEEITLGDTITRFTTTAPPVKIFDEREHQIQIHISELITGS